MRSPAPLRGVAPELLRVSRLHIFWWRVPPFGFRPALREIDVVGLTLNVVRDEQGRTSFDAIPSAAPPKPATPRSQLARELLSTAFPIHQLRVTDATLALVQTSHGVVIERDTVRGLSLTLSATPHLGGARLGLAVGSQPVALALTLDRSRPGAEDTSAALRVFLQAEASATDASLALELRVTRQNLIPEVTIEQLLQLRANAKFEPADRRIQLTVSRLGVADQMATNESALELPDQGSPLVRHASGDLDLARLLRLAAPWLPRLELAAGRLRYRVADLALDRAHETTSIALEGELSGARLALATGTLALTSARLSLHARPNGAAVDVEANLALNGLLLEAGTSQLRAEDVTLRLGGRRADNGAIGGQVEIRFSTLSVEGQSRLTAHDGHVALSARELRADRGLLDATGYLSLDSELGKIEAGSGARCTVSKLRWHAETRFQSTSTGRSLRSCTRSKCASHAEAARWPSCRCRSSSRCETCHRTSSGHRARRGACAWCSAPAR